MSNSGIVVYVTGPRGESTPIVDMSSDPLIPAAAATQASA